jgi:hypothetical protein
MSGLWYLDAVGMSWLFERKWVVSRSLKSVGPNATLVQNDVWTVLRELKVRLVGEIDVAGPDLARSLTDLGLVDEYRLYFRPLRARSRHAILRRPPAAAPTCGQRSNWRGHDQVGVRSRLVTLLAGRTAPTRQVRFASSPSAEPDSPGAPGEQQ